MRPRATAALRTRWSAAVRITVLALSCSGPASAAGLTLQAPRWTREHMESALQDRARWRFIYGTRDPSATSLLRDRAHFVARRLFGGDSSWVLADRDVDAAALTGASLLLVGSPRENTWTQQLAPALPLRFGEASFEWQGTRYARPDESVTLVHPNPLDPERFLIVMAGNSRDAMSRRGGFLFGEDDWRISRAGELVRSGRFAQSAAAPWRYDAALDRDRDAERARYQRQLVSVRLPGVELRAPGDLDATRVRADAESLLARLARVGLAAPADVPPIRLTLYRSLEEKGGITRDTRPEHQAAGEAHSARGAGRATHDLVALAAARLVQRGAGDSRFTWPAAAWLAGRFEGEALATSVARLVRAGLLPSAAEAARREVRWRSPLRMTPARGLLARAVWESAPAARRRDALLALTRREPPGTLDSLCAAAGVSTGDVTRRYAALADTLARRGAAALAARAPERWQPANGFQRGVCLAHSVRMGGGYLSAEAASTLTELRARGATWVSLTPFGYLRAPDSPQIVSSADSGPDEETDEAICEAAARARLAGQRVWLKPHLWTRGWVGELAFSARGWERFFEEYREFLLHWAILADRERIDGLFVGHELASSTRLHPARWRALIADVRKVHRGTLTYGANWDEAAHIPFWDDLDLVSVSFYSPIATTPTRDPRMLQAGVRRAMQALRPISVRTRKPVLLSEVGYAPTAGAGVRPWVEGEGAIDLETQRACYEALVEGIDRDLWIAGVFWWKWFTASGSGGGRDASFTPQGKPAEAVMTRALQSWEGRPVRAAIR